MGASRTPRVVIVTRATDLDRLVARHGTRAQAEFFLRTRGQEITDVEARHQAFARALAVASAAIPAQWRRNRIDRADLDRFLFEPDDIVVALGQDGLVANVAKYLNGQPVIGLNPAPRLNPGVLVPHAPEAAERLLARVAAGAARFEERTMVEAVLDDGLRLVALNEVFVGSRTHQSARYRITWDGATERQSSSGLIVATGTGSTGWASSIHRERSSRIALPAPDDGHLVLFVREAWPSAATGTAITEARVPPGAAVTVVSEMDDDGVIFGDGIESDRLEFTWGRRVTLRAASSRLRMVVG